MKQDIMIGTWAWGTGYGGAKMVFGTKYDEETLIAAFRKATELGFLNWDTAAVYGMGTCESLLGRLIHDRDDIFISTKYFPGSRFKSGALEKSFGESMQRLQRTSADIFWIDHFGNLICFSKSDKSIIFMNMETLEIETIASDFSGFLNKLYKLD